MSLDVLHYRMHVSHVTLDKRGMPHSSLIKLFISIHLSVCLSVLSPVAAMGLGEAQFGEGEGDINLNNIKCQGNESRLISCHSSGYLAGDCQHREDAAVICRGMQEIPPLRCLMTITTTQNWVLFLWFL